MNFNENDLWRDKTNLQNLRFPKLHSVKVLLKLEFDSKDQVLLLVILENIYLFSRKIMFELFCVGLDGAIGFYKAVSVLFQLQLPAGTELDNNLK